MFLKMVGRKDLSIGGGVGLNLVRGQVFEVADDIGEKLLLQGGVFEKTKKGVEDVGDK